MQIGKKQSGWLAAACPLVAACSSSTQEISVREIVEDLSTDEMLGRDNESTGAALARTFLVRELDRFAEPIAPEATGEARYEQEFDSGTNLLAIIPGTDLADEYIIIGAHYDGVGNDC